MWLLEKVIKRKILMGRHIKFRIYKPRFSKRRFNIPSPNCGSYKVIILTNKRTYSF